MYGTRTSTVNIRFLTAFADIRKLLCLENPQWEARITMSTLEHELYDQISAMWVIDSHEHLPPEKDRLELELDAVTLFDNYTRQDLRIAGMSRDEGFVAMDTSRPLDERWELFNKYFPSVRNTSFFRNILLGVRELYGFDDINNNNYQELTAVLKKENKPGIYEHVLRDHCKILLALNQEFEAIWQIPDPGNFRIPQLWESQLNIGLGLGPLTLIDNELGRSVSSLDDYVEALEELMAHYRTQGVCGIKLIKRHIQNRPSAEDVRPLFEKLLRSMDPPPPSTLISAKECWNRYFQEPQRGACFPEPSLLGDESGLSSNEATALRDFVAHAMIEAAGRVGMVIIFHCGCKGLWGDYRTANAANMVPVFMQHPEVRFELYHGGLPWSRETGFIAKGFPNVWLNLCWAHALSQTMARSTLDEWLDLVPANKIIGFGADQFLWLEWVVGDLIQARENIAAVLAKRVQAGIFTEEHALNVARMMLFDNSKNLYKLDCNTSDKFKYV